MRRIFDFSMQLMLVTLFFGTMSVPGYGQFVTSTGTVNDIANDNGGPPGCIKVGDKQNVFLLFILNNDFLSINNNVDLSKVDFGCDLHLGIKSSSVSPVSSFWPLSQIDSSQVKLVEAKDFGYEDSTSLGLLVNINISLSIAGRTCTNKNNIWEKHIYSLNLYCFDGEFYEEFNPCELDNFLFLESAYENCTFEKIINVRVCCVGELGTSEVDVYTEGRSSNFDDQGKMINLKYKENAILVESQREGVTKVSHRIYSLQGQLISTNEIEIWENQSRILDLLDLPVGLYISVFLDDCGIINSRRFVRI